MQYQTIGQTDLKVSQLSLGTMTWGQQNTQEDAHQQLDLALEHGINHIDTAEMYPSPPTAETHGLAEQYIGNWLKRSGHREQVVLASKVAGRSNMDWFRQSGETTRPSATQIREAVESSLQRLQTDWLDICYLHWPDRPTNYFGRRDFCLEPHADAISLAESLSELGKLIDEGKIRHIGLSNETPWGLMHCLELAKTQGLPRVQVIQNPYSLLNRTFELGLAECCHYEQVSLFGHSPLAFGVLTGKYLHGEKPKNARLTEWPKFTRYSSERGMTAAAHYVKLAENNGLSPAQMAIAFSAQHDFMTSTIIGATTLDQLRNNIASLDISLDDKVLAGIEKIHNLDSNPCP